MKRYNIYKGVMQSMSLLLFASLTFSFTSCDSTLNTDNYNNVPAHEELNSLTTLQETTANLYAQPWYFFQKRRFIQLGDCRGNNIYSGTATNDYNIMTTFNEENENTAVSHAWGGLYNVITQAAYVIDDYAPYCVEQGKCTQVQANVCIAEARFMRALAYWNLAMFWHDVPIVGNAVTVNAEAYANRFEDVLQYAITEAEFAEKWLPEIPYQTGRVSKVSANALLSRLYLTAASYAKGGHYNENFITGVLDKYYNTTISDIARFYYQKALDATNLGISESGSTYGMMDDYEDIWKVKNNNCKESLFAIQFVPGCTTTGLKNELQGEFCYARCLDANYGMGYLNPSYDFVFLSKKRGGLDRTRGNIMLPGFTYDYLYHEFDNGQYCTTGNKKGENWTVESVTNSWTYNHAYIKKYVVGGPLATDGIATNGNSGLVQPMIRYSELYLNQTEAMMGLADVTETTDPDILTGVNKVRRRAYKYEIENGIYPGDYGKTGVFNLDSLLQERRLEFYLEGIHWSDVVRRSFRSSEDLQHMLDYANNKIISMTNDSIMGCHRTYQFSYRDGADPNHHISIPTLRVDNTTGDNYIVSASKECQHVLPVGSWCHSSDMGITENLWSMIYPPAESLQDPNLLLAPVSYDFSTIISNKSDYHE